MENPFPSDVSFQALSQGSQPGVLAAPAEEELTRGVSAGRAAELRLGRLAAKLALVGLGFSPPPAVLRGASREPLWPPGIVGSISHTAGWALAAVARSERYIGLGLDLESGSRQFRVDVLDKIALPPERDWVADSAASGPPPALRALALFSAKESVFKAVFPLVRRYVGFEEVLLSWDAAQAAFIAQPIDQLAAALGLRIFRVGLSLPERATLVLTHVSLLRDQKE